jgi:non-heme chloroperoxidase
MSTISSHHTHNGDVRLHYLDSGGDDRGAPIVFVPGMTDIAEDYLHAIPLFGRRIVVMEFRGHGQSSAPHSGYDFAALCGDVGAIVDAVTTGPVHLVTFSRGTTYAAGWAIGHPGRVRSIAIGDYVPEERVVTDVEARTLIDGRWRGSPVVERLDSAAAMQTFHAAEDRSMWDDLSELQIPLLAVRSSTDLIISDGDWNHYRELFPDAQLVEFTGSPHDIFRTDRSRYPHLVREHVDRVDAG